MNLIDNVVAVVSPKAAYERQIYRQAYESIRSSYDAGNYEKSNRNWHASNTSAELTDRYSRDNVRARARDLERNSDIMNAVVGAYKRNVVGGGYHVQAKTGDAELNKQIEKAWNKWCKARNCDVTGTQSLNQIIRMAVQRKRIDGGVLFVKRYTKDGFVPFQLQMLEVDELDSSMIKPHYKDNKVVGGIEYNAFNRPVGYHIRQYDIDGYSPKEAVFIDAKDVIFYFTKKRPSQLREMSDVAHTVTRIRDVNEFMTAVSVKERIGACLSVFIKRTLPTTGFGRNNTPDRTSYDGKMLTPGMIMELNAGDEAQTINPAGQGSDATAFTKLQQRLIGAGQGISYESTSRDMSESTYSSARQAWIEDDLTYSEDKELLMEVLDEIYETFIISAVLSGVLSIPKFWNQKEMYLGHEWVQEPKPWIDPQKESNANKTAIQTGQKTLKQIAAESGRDWCDQVDDMVEVLEYGKSKGINLGEILYGIKEEKPSNVGEGGKSGQEE